MEASRKSFAVVAGVDFSQGSGDAVREAVRLVRRGVADEVHAVYVIPESERHARRHMDEGAEKMAQSSDELRAFVARHGGSSADGEPPTSVGLHVRLGDPAQELHRAVVQLDADLIVIGPHQHGLWKRRAVGGVAGRILEAAHCPVLVARPKDYAALSRVPEIDPPCPRCLEVRQQSGGAQWWCDTHSQQREPIHVYSTRGEVQWGEHDSEVAAVGVGSRR